MPIGITELTDVQSALAGMKDRLFHATSDQMTQEVADLLVAIEHEIDLIEMFTREEAFASFGAFDAARGHAKLTSIPKGVSYERRSDTEGRFIFPIWFFRSHSHARPPYHRASFIRENQFLYALIQTLVPYEERFRKPAAGETALCQVTVYVYRRYAFADFDKFNLHALINALAAHSVIVSDHPARLSIGYTFCFTDHPYAERMEVTITRCTPSPADEKDAP